MRFNARARRAGSARRATPRPIAWRVLVSGLLLCAVAVVFLLPLFLMVSVSLKSAADLIVSPLGFPWQLRVENYVRAAQNMNYLRSVANTVGITAVAAVFAVFITSAAAYPLARSRSRWLSFVYQFFLFGLVIPGFAGLTPLYILIRNLGLTNTYAGIVLLYVTYQIPFGVFFYTSFIRSLPVELEEAALIDGCTPFAAFRWVVFPLLKPATGTLTMFITLGIWNDFLTPLLFLNKPEMRTIMSSAYSVVGPFGFDPSSLFASLVLASLPLLVFFLVLQKQIIAGIAAGAVKG